MRAVLVTLAGVFLLTILSVTVLAQEPEPPSPAPPEDPVPPPPPPPPPPKPARPVKPDEPKEPDNSPPDQKKIDEAVKKGVNWLAKLQQKDGSFKTQYTTSYPMGCTALALLALLKSGVNPGSPAIRKGFAYLEDLPLNRMYSVAIYVMALEALFAPSEKQMGRKGKPYITVLRENIRRKARVGDKSKVSKCVEWIISHQQQNVWRYPTGGEDLSNTQYALLALYSGMRMGCRISPKVFRKAGDYLIVNQEKAGEEVKPFPVPAADFSIKELRKLEKEIREALKKNRTEARKKDSDLKKSGPSTTVIEDPYSRFGVERGEHKMYARGWSYTAPQPPKEGQKAYPMYCTGSMTTAGLACGVIVKTGLEGSKYYPKEYTKLLNKSIRDGAAWIFKYFTVTKNPTSRSTSGNTHYLYYYLYGLERAGILTLCTRFGEHDWYNKGAKYILEQQKKEGYWEGYKTPARQPQPGQAAPPPRPPNHVDTCFALLFLKKATVPVVSIPEEIYTGQDLFGDKKKKDDVKKPEKEGEQKKEQDEPPAQTPEKKDPPAQTPEKKALPPEPKPQEPAGKGETGK
jgi:hypothetical protein